MDIEIDIFSECNHSIIIDCSSQNSQSCYIENINDITDFTMKNQQEEEFTEYSRVFLSQTSEVTIQASYNFEAKNNKQKQCDFSYNYQKEENNYCYVGLTVTNNGDLRFTPNMNIISFGNQQQKIQQIVQFKNQNILELHYQTSDNYNSKLQQQTYSQFIETLQICLKETFLQVSSQMQKFQFEFNQSVFNNNKNNEINVNERYDIEEKLINQCYQQLQFGIQSLNNEQMYSYTIGRISKNSKIVENLRTGYSQSYLEFLGIDSNQLSSLILRSQKIDLIKDKSTINQNSIEEFASWVSMINENKQTQFQSTYDILTFDNFPIKIIYTKNNFLSENNEESEFLYFVCLTELDINIQDLEQLIQYRSQIILDKNQNEIQKRKEMSYLFEDVEYSVLSQAFIERFYPENINRLLNQQEYILYSTYNKKKPFYRYINNNQKTKNKLSQS